MVSFIIELENYKVRIMKHLKFFAFFFLSLFSAHESENIFQKAFGTFRICLV